MEANVPIVVAVLLLSSLLNAVYYFRVIGIAFFSTNRHENNVCTEVPWEMGVPLVVLASSLIFFGLQVGMLRNIVKPAVQVLWR